MQVGVSGWSQGQNVPEMDGGRRLSRGNVFSAPQLDTEKWFK